MQRNPLIRKILIAFEVQEYVDIPHDATEAEALELGKAAMEEIAARTGLYYEGPTLDVTELDI